MSKLMVEREYVLPVVGRIGTPKFRRWVVDHLPMKNLHLMRDVIDDLHRTATEIFETKQRALKEGDEALANQVDQAKDLISILMKANMAATDEDKLSDSEVLAQASR
ncbi:hypothetical protein H0H93_001830 [Arthromyces matolae]|nr:hypothetical protein H0H93_001830 [Arthromyces matolae]